VDVGEECIKFGPVDNVKVMLDFTFFLQLYGFINIFKYILLDVELFLPSTSWVCLKNIFYQFFSKTKLFHSIYLLTFLLFCSVSSVFAWWGGAEVPGVQEEAGSYPPRLCLRVRGKMTITATLLLLVSICEKSKVDCGSALCTSEREMGGRTRMILLATQAVVNL
jgi:hypothetical protein